MYPSDLDDINSELSMLSEYPEDELEAWEIYAGECRLDEYWF